jgi:hypothetical protein
VHQNNGIDHTIEFIRENALARVIDSRPTITSRGERFLQELSESAIKSDSGLSGVF